MFGGLLNKLKILIKALQKIHKITVNYQFFFLNL